MQQSYEDETNPTSFFFCIASEIQFVPEKAAESLQRQRGINCCKIGDECFESLNAKFTKEGCIELTQGHDYIILKEYASL